MSWSLKGIAGPLKNKVFPLKSGLTLGRQGDIVIPDTKASSIHARVTKDASGQWVIADNNSKNGTRIKGQRVPFIPLEAGTVFYIGDQGFQIISDEAPKKAKAREKEVEAPVDWDKTPPPAPKPKPKRDLPKLDLDQTAPPAKAKANAPDIVELDDSTQPPIPAPSADPAPREERPEPTVAKVNIPPQDDLPEPPPAREPEPEPVPEPPKPKPKRYWHEILAQLLAENQENFHEKKKPVSALNPAVVLEFVRGLQVSTHWVLGYGPRRVGSSSLDLPIFEPGAPAVCFEIFPSSDGIVFKTNHPDLVLVNGQGVDSHTLRVGDVIRINETLIEVDFEE